MRLAALTFLLGAGAVLVGACDRPAGDGSAESPRLGTELGAPVTPPAIDVARAAADPSELARAIGARHRDGASRLGAHRLRATAKIQVLEGERSVEAWDEEALLERDAAGAFHVLATNTKDYGREAWGTSERLWIRPRWGKYHRRTFTAPDEGARLCDETWATLPAHYELVAHAAKLTDGGEATVAGRRARRVALTLGEVRPRTPERLTQRAWRDQLTVQALEGEVALDAETGALLEGRLSLQVGFVREGRAFNLRLSATHQVSDVGGVTELAPPSDEESVDTPRRSRDLDERDALLDGLAPPARHGPASTPAPAPTQ